MARVTSPVFIGRRGELDLLAGAFAAAAGEAARVVLLGGEAGVGKTRLLRESLAGREDATVLMGSSFGVADTSSPYAPAIDAVRRLLRSTEPARWPALLGWTRRELAILLPELTDARSEGPPQPTSDVGQGRLFAAFLGLLDRLGRERPTVFVLEDIHWADRSTLDLIAYLAHALERERVMLLVTFRSDELAKRQPLRSLISRLERLERAERIDLGPLDSREVARLIEKIQGRPPDTDLIEDVVARSQGNAFFVEELVAVQAEGRHVPRALRDLLELRLETVPRRARRLLDVASVAGSAVDEALLRKVSGFSKAAVAGALHEAIDHGLLVRDDDRGGGYVLRHALMAETIRARMLDDERQDLHRAIASWLQARAASGTLRPEMAGAIAHHWDAAGDATQALPWLIEAGAAAEASFAWAEAERHFTRALGLWDEAGTASVTMDRAAVAGSAAEAAFGAGRYERAARLGRDAVSLLDAEREPVRLARQLARLTHFLMWTRDTDEALASADRALRLVPEQPPSRERAEVLSWRAAILTFGLRIKEAGSDAASALAIAREVGDTVTQGRALCVLGIAQAEDGRLEEGLASLEEYRRIATETNRPIDAARADLNTVALLVDDRRYEEALAVALRGVELSLRSGLDRAMGDATQFWVAYCLMALGRTDEADAVMRDLIATVRDERQRTEGLVLHGWILVRAGRLDEADGPLGVDWRVDEHHPSDTSRYLMAHVELLLLRAQWEDAVEFAKRGRGELDPLHHHAALSILSVGGIVSSLAAGRPAAETAAFAADLRAVTARCRRHRAACHVVTPVWVRLGEAEIERVAGRSSPRRWRACVAGLAGLPEPYWQMLARFRLAESLIESGGSRAEAAEALAAARSAAASLSASLVADIDSLARRARLETVERSQTADGASAAAPRSQKTKVRDPFALTPRESQVLDCLVAGLSDGEIADRLRIAKATASVHVMNIKQKLGAETRVEAVVRAIRDGLVQVTPR